MEIEQKVTKIEYNANPFLNQEEPKSKGTISNIEIHFNKRFNCIQRFMWKVCFGLEISNLKKA